MWAPLTAVALGLGEVSVNSGLNQPLDADVKLIAADPAQLGDIKAEIASAGLFEKAGVERPFVLSQLRFQPRISQGGVIIRITSRQPIVEPFLNFLLEVNVNGARFIREYAILLDPQPLRARAGRGAERPPAIPSQPVEERYGPVAAGETLWRIAENTRPDSGITIEQMMLALQQRNPAAFAGGNINRLKRGVVLTIPGERDILGVEAAEAKHKFQMQTRQWRDHIPPTDAVATVESKRAAEPEIAPTPSHREPEGDERALRVVETEGLLPTGEGHIAYPVNQEEKLHETTKDTQSDLEAAREINQGLAELKSRLESRIEEFRLALEERDSVIDQLTRQLDQLEAAGRVTSASESNVAAPTFTAKAPNTSRALPSADLASGSSPLPVAWGSSWLDHNLQSVMAVIVVVIILITVLVWRSGRRRELTDRHPDLEIFQSIDVAETDQQELDSLVASIETDHPGSTLSESDRGDVTSPKGDVASVLMEVDIYLAYRRYSQAESLITSALATRSEKSGELMAKLLEIYLFQGNKEAFSDYLEEAHSYLTGTSPSLWQHVVEMGRKLVPDHPLLASVANPGQRGAGRAAADDQDVVGDALLSGDESDQQEFELDIDIDALLDTDSVLEGFTSDEEVIPVWNSGERVEETKTNSTETSVIEDEISIEGLDLSELEEIDLDIDTNTERKPHS